MQASERNDRHPTKGRRRLSEGREKVAEIVILLILITWAHLYPFGEMLGFESLQKNLCESIAGVFGMLSASLMTCRVLFHERWLICRSIEEGQRVRVFPIIALGALTICVWLLHFLVGDHLAEVLSSALVVAVSQLAAIAVDKRIGLIQLAEESVPLMVLAVIGLWIYCIGQFSSNHGDVFLAATTVGASSMNAFQTLIQAIRGKGRTF